MELKMDWGVRFKAHPRRPVAGSGEAQTANRRRLRLQVSVGQPFGYQRLTAIATALNCVLLVFCSCS